MEQFAATAHLPETPRWTPSAPADAVEGAVPAGVADADAASLTLAAGPRTDWFADPAGKALFHDARALTFAPGPGDYQLLARVRVDFAATYDAGVLVLYAGEDRYAKLCFEYSPEHRPMVVSVVTRHGASDDANAFHVEGDTVWLRVSRTGAAFAFHASTDGERWEFVRYFRLDGDGDATRDGAGTPETDQPRAGFMAQSPTGEGCRATFDQVRFTRATLADLRDGS
ncbi:DUF1349 domain-containing protein [Allostreptomyces psammosilenae]|uniref:DUF1349 domain-containing protein n=1 Tax=Allostreptomyces psammosilenae TaxID=1892865 RepID=A0A853A590_9ACTN|nr:DUF1349 domain-containing protein [Allostreptomyces psammosilenae]NYI08034.1 hypothetical protein [Allostreptomyces psammosilenae]